MGMNPEEIRILHSDRWLTVCIKPAGMLSESELPDQLAAQCGGKFYCVHRLDRQVGGIMVFARDGKTAAALSNAFSGHEITKVYLAVCEGGPESDAGQMQDLLFHDSRKNKTFVVDRMRKGVREAALDWKLLAATLSQNQPISLFAIKLGTGRSHQIRVQFSHRHMPLIGDRRYGSHINASMITLWSAHLAFKHPVTGKQMEYSCLPDWNNPWSCFDQVEFPLPV